MARDPKFDEVIERTFRDLDKIVAEHGEGNLFFLRMLQGVMEAERVTNGRGLENAIDLHAETFKS